MIGKRGIGILALTVLLCGGQSASAQRPDPPRTPQDRAEMEQRIRAQMARVVKERLELTDAEAERLSEVVRSYERQRRDLFRSEQATRRRVEALVLDGGTDQEARELLDRMADLRREEAQLFDEEQAALLEVLSPVKVLQLQTLREEMGRRIRSLRGRGRRGGDEREGRGRRPGTGNVDWLPGVPLSR